MGTGPIDSAVTDDVRERLGDLLERRWLLVGIGNDLRGDDAFGPLLARRLKAAGLPALDVGSAPENATGPIRRADPDVLILADATHLGAPPGTLSILSPGALTNSGTSTHDPSLRLLLGYLAANKPIDAVVLAAQPASLLFGSEPSREIHASIDAVSEVFLSASACTHA